MDRISKKHRSWNMSKIRSKDTKPEIAVRSILHKMGYRFRLGAKDVPGKPDVVLRRYKTAVFVHGCFWHRHEGCKFAYTPKSNVAFWEEKFRRNIERDEIVGKELRKTGWLQIIVWECELSDIPKLEKRLRRLIRSRNPE